MTIFIGTISGTSPIKKKLALILQIALDKDFWNVHSTVTAAMAVR